MRKEDTRITGPLFTVRVLPYRRYCGLAFGEANERR